MSDPGAGPDGLQPPRPLDELYAEAQQALHAREDERAARLLRQILIADENYQDASALLARLVRARRRRWYNDPRLWGPLGIAALVALAVWLVPRLPEPDGAQPTPTADLTLAISTAIPAIAPSSTPPDTPIPAPTAIPLAWKRIYSGLEFARDSITALVVDPTDADVIYVGTRNGGVYKSIDGGIAWRPAHTGLGTASIATLAIDPTDTRTLYVATLLGGVYATSDGGDQWTQVNQGLRNPTDLSNETSTVIVDPHDSSHFYYLDPMHIYETWAGMDRWQAVVDGEAIGRTGSCSPYFQDMAAHPLQPGRLLVLEGGELGCTPGVYVVDADTGYRTLLFGATGPSDNLWELGVDSLSGEHLYVTGSDEKGGLLYSSSDGGETWLMNSVLYGSWYCRSIAVSPVNGEIAYCATDSGLYGTSDGGQTWRRRTMWPAEEMERFVQADGQSIFLAGEGLSVSQDGGSSWEPRQDGLGATFLQLTVRPSRADTLYLEEGRCVTGTRHDTNLFASRDGGSTWSLEADRGCGAAFSLDGQVIYRADYENSAVLHSEEGRAPWTATPLSGTRLFAEYLSTIPPDLGTLFVAFHDYRTGAAPEISRDNGSTWVSTRLQEGRMVLAHDLQGAAIYAFSNEGGAYRSTTTGVSWSACQQRLAFRPSEISTQFALVHPLDNRHVLVGSRGGGVLVSRDGCGTWDQSNNGLGSLFVNALAADPNDPYLIYAGTDGGAFVSFDGGETWGEINEGLLGATVVYSIVVDPESNVYAATPYGIFQLEAR